MNLRNEQVEVFRGPDLRARRYRVMRIARHGERLTLRSLRGGSVAVDEVLPER